MQASKTCEGRMEGDKTARVTFLLHQMGTRSIVSS
jgi:hypothetical protein